MVVGDDIEDDRFEVELRMDRGFHHKDFIIFEFPS